MDFKEACDFREKFHARAALEKLRLALELNLPIEDTVKAYRFENKQQVNEKPKEN